MIFHKREKTNRVSGAVLLIKIIQIIEDVFDSDV